MKKCLLSIIAFILLSSCAEREIIYNREVLYDQYMRFVSLLNEHSYMSAIDMLSQRNMDDLTSHSGKKDFTQYFPVISTINQVLSERHGNFEELRNNVGCLTVFGVDPSNEPTSVNIEYVNESGFWKIDYVQVIYHDSTHELPRNAECPARM